MALQNVQRIQIELDGSAPFEQKLSIISQTANLY